MMIPYRFCFKSKAKGYYLYYETAIDIFFMCDFGKNSSFIIFLGFNFITGYYKKGHVVMKRGIIIKHYLRTWFLIDLIATFPYSWIVTDKKIEYWPEEHEIKDESDSSNAIDSNNSTIANVGIMYDPYLPFNYHYKVLSAGLPPVFTTTSATDFGLPALLRLLKLVRLVRLIKAL